MKLKAVFARTTTDQIKSKIKSPQLSELILEVYMTPEQFSELVNKYYDSELTITIND